MSTSRDSCCLPSVKKQKHDFQVFAFVQCIIKQLLDSVFVISRIIKVSVRVISLSLRLRLITLTSTLIILDITKTSSNNCLLIARVFIRLLIYYMTEKIMKSRALISL